MYQALYQTQDDRKIELVPVSIKFITYWRPIRKKENDNAFECKVESEMAMRGINEQYYVGLNNRKNVPERDNIEYET